MKQNPEIIIVPIAHVNKYKYLVLKNEWQWSFFGTDACLRERIINKIGDLGRYYYAEELAEISIKNKKPFLNWIAEIGKKQDHPFWWGTNIAYKNPLSSNLFLSFCLLTLIRGWADRGVKKRLVIVEHPALLRAFAHNLNGPAILIENSARDYVGDKLKTTVFTFARMALFFTRYLYGWLINKWYRLKYKDELQNLLNSKPDILLYTWVEDRSFTKERFTDIYLGKLKEFYDKNGYKTAFIISPQMPRRLMKKVYQSGEIIPALYFISLLDIIKSFFHSVSFKWNNALPYCDKFNLKTVFEYEKKMEKGMLCYSAAIFYGIYNFFKEKGVNIRVFIYPFENQPWDKMAILGMRQAESRSKIVAYQHTVVPWFLLNYFLGNNERGIHPEPDVIIANGDTWTRVLKKSGFTCPVYNGGSVRYSKSVKKEDVADSDEKKQNVLVLLSPVLSYTLDLLFYLKRRYREDRKYLLKPHPDMPEKTIRKYAGSLPSNFVFIEGVLNEWFNKVGWAIHIGTTAALECMLNGITVYKYLPERIDADPFLGMNIPQWIVTDSDMMAFERSINMSSPDPNIIAEEFHETVWIDIAQ